MTAQARRWLQIGVILALVPILGALAFPDGARAETRMYIAENLKVIPVRAGKGMNFKIIAFLAPGATVVRLEDNDPEWAHIRLGGGKDGWILRRYLTTQKPSAQQLSATQQQLEFLQKKVAALGSTNQEYRRGNTNLLREVSKLNKKLKNLEADYKQLREDAAQYLELKSSHEELQGKFREIKTAYDKLRAEQDKLQKSYTIKWFLSGASVILIGIFIGLIIQGLRGRRRRTDTLRFK